MSTHKYDPGYPKNSRSLFPPEDYVPLSDEERRELISNMCRKIRLEMAQEAATGVLHSPEGMDTGAKVLHFPDELTKTCNDCGEVKPISQYYDRPRGKLGKHATCKPCMRIKALQNKRAA